MLNQYLLFLKNKFLNTILIAASVLIFNGCSTQKNTGMSRFYQNTVTKFNVYFNGNESYKEGMESIKKANKDDFSQILAMYPSSNHENLKGASSSMDRAIEKSRKAIKLHSIKKKPQKNYKKWNNPKYRAWYEQTEFNPALKEAWLMLAKSEFHKGEFLGSVGTFSYIINHYSTEPDVADEAKIWTARAYIEMGWDYEAEDMLKKLSTEKLNRKNTALFSGAMANLLLKKEQYKEAIPYLKLAVDGEKDKSLATRFKFILAQIYALTNDKTQAINYYSQVIKASPAYEMELSARLNRAQLYTGNNVQKIEKELKGMAKSGKNKDYLDQIYTTLGNVYLQAKDTAKAIENFDLAKEKSTKNGIEKGIAEVKLGDLYYDKKEYIKAAPNYSEAATIIPNEYFDYPRISKRAEVLGELTQEDEVVVLQDSLQKLAGLSEKDRLEAINKIIENVKKQEEEAKKKLEEENNPNLANRSDDFVMPGQMIGGGNFGNDWYFYNSSAIRSGKADFNKKWGKRKLEDNWQRLNKSAALFADNNSEESASSQNQSGAANDSTSIKTSDKSSTDNKSVDFYLQQIPLTYEQIEKSNEEIADALFNMGFIFKDKMQDYPMAIETFEEFEKRFPTDKRVLESIYQRFLVSAKQGNSEDEEKYRSELLTRYPQSNYAQMLREPDFVNRMKKMYEEQDSLYNKTYTAYTRSDFNTVFKNTEYIQKKYPLSALMPKFEFLNALSIGKTQKSDLFRTSLDSLVAHYPESDVSAMAKDILALMKQGNVAQLGKTHGSLLEKRAEEVATEEGTDLASLSDSKDGKHRLLFVGNLSDSTMNKLLYNVAMFNFSRFMIKDFDLETGKINNQEKALSVGNLESYDEALWYEKTLLSDKELSQIIDSLHIKLIPISDDNFGKLKALFTLDEYLDFQKKNLAGNAPEKLVAKAKPAVVKTEEPKIAEQPKPTETKEVAQNTTVKETPKQTENTQQAKTTAETQQTVTQPAKTEETKTVEPVKVEEPAKVEEPVAWFKNIYAYRPNAPHFVTLYVPNGDVSNFDAIKKAFDKYNATNYGMLNLKTSLESFGKEKAIIIGTFVDANTAKSYMLRMLRDKDIVEATKGLNKRNLVGTQENLNTMVQKNDLNTYFEFMKEYYLK